MSALDDLFQEEYDRLHRMANAMERERAMLPKGYLSKKNIKGREYFYLQQRDGKQVKSTFISLDDVDELSAKIQRRRQLDAMLKDVHAQMKKLERVI